MLKDGRLSASADKGISPQGAWETALRSDIEGKWMGMLQNHQLYDQTLPPWNGGHLEHMACLIDC